MLGEKYDPLAYSGILPGTRVIAFDSRIWINDKVTPPSMTFKPATVVCHYGRAAERYGLEGHQVLGPYGSLVDLIFDHNPDNLYTGKFTYGLKLITEENQHAR